MDNKIKKLLKSMNEDDIRIGWELLKTMENGPKGKEWYPYFNFIRSNCSSTLTKELLFSIVGEDYSYNQLWRDWNPKSINYEDF